MKAVITILRLAEVLGAAAIVHELLRLNFPCGWRPCG